MVTSRPKLGSPLRFIESNHNPNRFLRKNCHADFEFYMKIKKTENSQRNSIKKNKVEGLYYLSSTFTIKVTLTQTVWTDVRIPQ